MSGNGAVPGRRSRPRGAFLTQVSRDVEDVHGERTGREEDEGETTECEDGRRHREPRAPRCAPRVPSLPNLRHGAIVPFQGSSWEIA